MASCIRVQLNSSSFSIIYWSTLVFSLPSLQSDREQRLFMSGTSRKYFHFNSRQTLLHSSVTLSHTSCQPCIIDTWIFLSPPHPFVFNYSAHQTSRQARTSVCHLCTKAQCSSHSPEVPPYRTLTVLCKNSSKDRGRVSCQGRGHIQARPPVLVC